MLNATKREFATAFRKHIHVYRSVRPPHDNYAYKLILFYAVECGLKAIILERIKGNSLEDLLNHQTLGLSGGKDGHDIKRFLHFLDYSCKLPSLVCTGKKNLQLQVPPKEYNQVWRYGIGVETTREDQVVTELKEIAQWIEEGLA